jgi:HD superfamily phosphohydrolase
MTKAKIEFEREIRDPIYGYIFLTNYENNILDSDIFQRLDRIFQMPTAQFVYPSAKHTRKTHSLGAMHLCHKAIVSILYRHSEAKQRDISPLSWGEQVVIKEKERGLQSFDQKLRGEWWNRREEEEIIQSLRLAGMLHDVGHAPLSHLFEDVCKHANIKFKYKKKSEIFDHEIMSLKIIEEKEKELKIKAPFDADSIVEILKEDGQAPVFLHELISGAYDCDKLDYLARDAHATGAVEFGGIDCARILDGLRVVKENLCVGVSALDALMKSFDAVQYMYTSVYYHKTARVFDFMITEALTLIPEFLKDIVGNIDRFLKTDDYCFIYEARKYAEENKIREAVKLLDDFRYRRKKYKDIFSSRVSVDLLIRPQTEESLRKIEKALEKETKNLEIKVDFRPGIRPVGIEIEELPTWLTSERLYDPSDGKTKKLKDCCAAYQRRLTQYVILFRVYANRDQLKNDPDGKFDSDRLKVARLAGQMLDKLEDQYENLRAK